MNAPEQLSPLTAVLTQAGLSDADSRAWAAQCHLGAPRRTPQGTPQGAPQGTPQGAIQSATSGGASTGHDLTQDRASFGAFWQLTHTLLRALPPRKRRTEPEQRAAQTLLDTARESREQFLHAHVAQVYSELTAQHSRLLRVEDIAATAATAFPGLVPQAAVIEAEHQLTQGDKDGHEIDQGLLFAHILANQAAGMHLCHAMLLPHPKSHALQSTFTITGRVDLGNVHVEREGRSAIINLSNQKYLNAEDNTTVEAQELAVDLCLQDEASEIAVLRGARMQSGKYQGRRVFCTGINLTHLYHGKVPYLWYLTRELGWINKMFRGIASPDYSPDDMLGRTREKLWISAVDAFAIGGGCQYMLATDVNIAAADAYMTLPARKEGIVPGAANLRLPRFVGDRIARQAVMLERRIDCASIEGRMICDRIVEPGTLDAAVAEMVESIVRSGVVSAASNRKAFRVAHEPLDLFRRYMAVYAREQAYCHFSPALITNLERFWSAHTRRVG